MLQTDTTLKYKKRNYWKNEKNDNLQIQVLLFISKGKNYFQLNITGTNIVEENKQIIKNNACCSLKYMCGTAHMRLYAVIEIFFIWAVQHSNH